MITRTEILENERLNALPAHFGGSMMQVERAVYFFAETLCEEYHAGYWRFYDLDNGGFYMAPDTRAVTVDVYCEGNGFRGNMSPDAFGIVVCLFTLSHLSFDLNDTPDGERIAEHFYWLRDYAADHAEAREIFAAID